MGRVFEALNKADGAAAAAPAVAAPVATRPEAVDDVEDRPRAYRPLGPKPADFDFVSYSLNAPTLSEVERANEQEKESAYQRTKSTAPARTVELEHSRLDPRITASFDSMPLVSGEFNKVAIALISAASTQRIKRVLVTSAEHGSGKTSAAINIALALARGRKRVLLVDCDFQRPSVLRLLGLEAHTGLAEVVNDGARPGEAAIRITPSGVTVIPLLGRLDNPAEMLSDRAFPELLSMLENDYDFLIFDSAPLLHSAEARLLAPMMDRVILVISSGEITAHQLSTAISPLTRDQVLGVVLNRSEQAAQVV